MTESQWVKKLAEKMRSLSLGRRLEIRVGERLPYGHEITSAGEELAVNVIKYQTDLLIVEQLDESRWIPRVVLEAKLAKITTHDAITYSQKAFAHKQVHPYLRYGIVAGYRKHYPLAGRLFRHGAHFDFMFSFKRTSFAPDELDRFKKLVKSEVAASRKLEHLLYESRSPNRQHYTMLQRRLVLE